jgi:hypothetical protein
VREETLRNDGSTFVEWYMRLRSCLRASDTLFIIEEPLRDEPNDSEDEDDKRRYHLHRDLDILIQSAILSTMAHDLKVQFSNTNAFDIIDTLKLLLGVEFGK